MRGSEVASEGFFLKRNGKSKGVIIILSIASSEAVLTIVFYWGFVKV